MNSNNVKIYAAIPMVCAVSFIVMYQLANNRIDLMWRGPKQNVLDWITAQESLIDPVEILHVAHRASHRYWPAAMIFQNAAEIKELLKLT